MPIEANMNVTSAILQGQFGLDRAAQGITQASLNIAQRAAQQQNAANGPEGLLGQTALQQLTNLRDTLPSGDDTLTNDLLSLQLNSRNAESSARVIDTANETVGSIINIFA